MRFHSKKCECMSFSMAIKNVEFMYEYSPEPLRVEADKETGKADNRKERIGEEAKWARNKEFPRISYSSGLKSTPGPILPESVY